MSEKLELALISLSKLALITIKLIKTDSIGYLENLNEINEIYNLIESKIISEKWNKSAEEKAEVILWNHKIKNMVQI